MSSRSLARALALSLSTFAGALTLAACAPPPVAPPPVAPPPVAPPPAPAPPATPPLVQGHDPAIQCRSDKDCPADQVCTSRIIAACPTCDGGKMGARCEPPRSCADDTSCAAPRRCQNGGCR